MSKENQINLFHKAKCLADRAREQGNDAAVNVLGTMTDSLSSNYKRLQTGLEKDGYVLDLIAEDLERAAKEAAPLTLEERVAKLERNVGKLKRAILKAAKQINPKRTT